MPLDEIYGELERITFRNPENGYTIARVRVDGYGELVTAVGIFPQVAVGAYIRAAGQWQADPKYGQQFRCEQISEQAPTSVAGLERYLSSGLIKGVGPALAKRIVKAFGEATLDVLTNQPERLGEVQGLGQRKIEGIRKAWVAQQEVRYIQLFLQAYDVPLSFGLRIHKQYGKDSLQILQNDPYRLCHDIWGIGFKTADAIAQRLGLPPDSPNRQRAGLLEALRQAAENGHCYLTRDMTVTAASTLLSDNQPLALLQKQLDGLMREGILTGEDDMVYLPSLYHCEAGAAARLITLRDRSGAYAGHDLAVLAREVADELQVTFEKVQHEAMIRAWENRVSILTGGPGTGKTFTTKGILTGFTRMGARVLLAAPTGRAAKRLSESTGMEASTMHRMLGYRPDTGYTAGRGAQLECDVVLIDEMSMVDIVLFYHLLQALPDHATLVLVGDADQLPSVGPGNVLRDLLPMLPLTRLTAVFRQAARSLIVTNAHRILHGEMPVWQAELRDCFWVETDDGEGAAETVADLCARRLPGYLSINPLDDIQVLCPMRRGAAGSQELNIRLQAAMNPRGKIIEAGRGRFRAGDRVMQLRNNYDKDVFNGDLGRVVDRGWGEADEFTVDFDGRYVEYEPGELDELSTAYAMTIHKSQGCEFPVVVAPLTTQHYMMLQRNLLYTCVTRAKSTLVLVGSQRALRMAVDNADAALRNTALTKRLERLSFAR